MDPLDLSLHLTNTHVLITGGAGYIGHSIVRAFLSASSRVTVLDLHPSKLTITHPNLQVFPCDISSESSLISAFESASKTFGLIHCCICVASLDLSVLPHHESLTTLSVEQWRRTYSVNVEGTFLTARTWLRQIEKGLSEGMLEGMRNVGLVIVGSESGWFGERGNADYASGKSAVQVGFVQSLRGDVARVFPRARVNAVAPGPVDTEQFRRECEANPEQYWLDAQATCALREPVPTTDVAKAILFLASESWSGHITGQVLDVDSGKQGKVMWPPEASK